MSPRSVTIVGASLAGLCAAESLRRQGFDGELQIIGDERWLPYDRPPLSKNALKNGAGDEPPYLRDSSAYDALAAEWMLGRRCVGLDLSERTVALDDGASLPFQSLIIATGASPRRLSQFNGVEGVHVLRTWDDSRALDAEVGQATTAVIVGGGFIGCEVASSLRQRGLDVTVVEPFPTLLCGPFSTDVGELLNRTHLDHGVRLRMNSTVVGHGGGGRVESVLLADGSEIPADVVVLGLGAVPNTAWLEGSGIGVANGILCDAFGQTAFDGIFAVGDVAHPYSSLYRRRVRVEHWTSATAQGAAVAANVLNPGSRTEVVGVPYVWSDQYDQRLNYVGLHDRTDQVHLHIDAEDNWSAAWVRDGLISAVLAVGNQRLLPAMQRALGQPLDTSWPIEKSRAARAS